MDIGGPGGTGSSTDHIKPLMINTDDSEAATAKKETKPAPMNNYMIAAQAADMNMSLASQKRK